MHWQVRTTFFTFCNYITFLFICKYEVINIGYWIICFNMHNWIICQPVQIFFNLTVVFTYWITQVLMILRFFLCLFHLVGALLGKHLWHWPFLSTNWCGGCKGCKTIIYVNKPVYCLKGCDKMPVQSLKCSDVFCKSLWVLSSGLPAS